MAESDDKTEDPTQKRLDDAHAKGDVAKSQEVNTWFVIAGATLVLSTFSGSIGRIGLRMRRISGVSSILAMAMLPSSAFASSSRSSNARDRIWF